MARPPRGGRGGRHGERGGRRYRAGRVPRGHHPGAPADGHRQRTRPDARRTGRPRGGRRGLAGRAGALPGRGEDPFRGDRREVLRQRGRRRRGGRGLRGGRRRGVQGAVGEHGVLAGLPRGGPKLRRTRRQGDRRRRGAPYQRCERCGGELPLRRRRVARSPLGQPRGRPPGPRGRRRNRAARDARPRPKVARRGELPEGGGDLLRQGEEDPGGDRARGRVRVQHRRRAHRARSRRVLRDPPRSQGGSGPRLRP